MIRATASAPPRLRAKAAEARHLIRITGHILEFYVPLGTDHEKRRFSAVRAMIRMYDEVDNWREGSAERLGRSCREFMAVYKELRDNASSPALLRVYPKFHQLIHISEGDSNPRATWNYADESEIGEAAKFAATCNVVSMETECLAKHRLSKYSKS